MDNIDFDKFIEELDYKLEYRGVSKEINIRNP